MHLKNEKENIIKFIVEYSQLNKTNKNKFANDCEIAEKFFYTGNNYIQYYRSSGSR